MALRLALFAGHMVDHAAKVALLVCVGRERGLGAHFAALATAHVAANLRGAFMLFREIPRVPTAALAAAVLLFGIATPLMQVVHLVNIIAGWRISLGSSRRPSLRAAPLDTVMEGLVFVLIVLHIYVCLAIGRLEPLGGWFETLLALNLATSLATVATSLVVWDTTVSLRLSRAMYRWPMHRSRAGSGAGRGDSVSGAVQPIAARSLGGGPADFRGLCFFVCHITLRGTEVAAKSALLAVLAALLGPGFLAGYLAVSYLIGVSALLFAPPLEVPMRQLLGAALLLAWPLLFVNLPQFVDSPKHILAAQNVASCVTGLRALELAVALCAAVAVILLETEVEAGASDRAVKITRAWGTLWHRSAALGWGFCLLVHYASMVARSSGPAVPPDVAASPQSGGGRGGLLAGAGIASGEAYREEKHFWPPAVGLAPLLLAAGGERAPLAWPLGGAASSSAALATGRPAERLLRVEDFDPVRLLGFGEFGKVFLVRQRSTQETFAMKRLSKDFYSRRRMTEKAIREIATLHLARDHPFVVRLVYTIENAQEWAMVMEYCPRGDLHQLLIVEGSPGLALDRTLRISAEVTLALEHLHTRGIVFRDVKLENVVLDQEGHAKLTDFGLAKQHQGGRDAIAEAEQAGGAYASFTKTFCGSYGYAAPEVNPHRQTHGFAADMYSFGVLLLMMLMGGEVYHDTLEPRERRLPPETPNDLRNVLGQLGFEFYWASHHLLQSARATHRVEVGLAGDIVLVSRAPRGARRVRLPPARPPNSPRAQVASPDLSPELSQTAPGRPSSFPALACTGCEAARRRWDLALDLVRLLTNELPEHRGTVATLKRHAFFAEEISDWRMMYPRSWLLHRVRGKLALQVGGGTLPQEAERRLERRLEQRSAVQLIALLDSPSAGLEVMDGIRPEAPQEPPRAQAGRSALRRSSSASGISTLGRQSSPAEGAAHAWVQHYP